MDKLTKEETKEIFEKELANDYLNKYVDHLVHISRGRPILIVGILNAVAKNENITSVKTQEEFNGYVVNHFNTFIDLVVKETGVNRIKCKKLLSLICLLEPFDYDDVSLIKSMAETEQINEDIIVYFLRKLVAEGMSSGNYQKSIKPDYYSDIILMEDSDNLWVQTKIEKYSNHTANILMNLASIDEVESDKVKSRICKIDNLLHAYIEELPKLNYDRFIDRMRFAYSIAIQKPVIAEVAIHHFFDIVKDKECTVNIDFNKYGGGRHIYNDLTAPIIKGILHELLYHSDRYGFVFDASISLFNITGDKLILNSTFSYCHGLYLYSYSIEHQTYFVKRASELLYKKDSTSVLFQIYGLSEMLKLSFSLIKENLYSNYSFDFYRYKIPMVDDIKEHRISVIKLLIKYHACSSNERIKNESLKVLLDIPREISANVNSDERYKYEEEMELILLFLEKNVASFNIASRIEVIDNLHWYRRNRVPKKFHFRLDAIESLLNPQNLTDELLTLFIKLQNSLRDDRESELFRINRIIENNSAYHISDAISKLHNSESTLPYYYNEFLNGIFQYPLKAKEIYLHLKENNKHIVYAYGSGF
ncbi:hypothetical protein [Chitinophaga barathri]|uniref:Uncharacterized protein n=1 Tax=Chitinophaga barathri TaxID=1647451 RepID=A0A3N4MD08_9BACT|nr:hypothetical protein [Chitinophaga barathri]RPD39437.1 hypothetical protein EG028_20155 [Chitinophaga barathri]